MSKVADRNQRQLLELLKLPGNDICADCRARNPRWTSWNIGIFICVNCASLHRKMGTHISKVKSMTMDTWSKEQVEHMKNVGNLKSNALLNPDETNNPPPSSVDESERGYLQEKYVREKYEERSFVSRSRAAPPPELPRRPSSATQASPLPSPSPSSSAQRPSSPALPRPSSTTSPLQTPTLSLPTSSPDRERNKHVHFARSVSVPIPDIIDPPPRVPSATINGGVKKGILRPRSSSGTIPSGGPSTGGPNGYGERNLQPQPQEFPAGMKVGYNPFGSLGGIQRPNSTGQILQRSSPNPFAGMEVGKVNEIYQTTTMSNGGAGGGGGGGGGSSILDNLDFLGGGGTLNSRFQSQPPQPSYQPQTFSSTPTFDTPSPSAPFLRPQQTGYFPPPSVTSLRPQSTGYPTPPQTQSTGYPSPSPTPLQPQSTGYPSPAFQPQSNLPAFQQPNPSPSPLVPQPTGLRKGFVPTSDFGKKEFADLGLGTTYEPPQSFSSSTLHTGSNALSASMPASSSNGNGNGNGYTSAFNGSSSSSFLNPSPSNSNSYQQQQPSPSFQPQQPSTLYPSPGMASPGANGTNPFFNMSASLGSNLPLVSPMRPQATGYNPFFQQQPQQQQQNFYQSQPQQQQQLNPFLQGYNSRPTQPNYSNWGN